MSLEGSGDEDMDEDGGNCFPVKQTKMFKLSKIMFWMFNFMIVAPAVLTCCTHKALHKITNIETKYSKGPDTQCNFSCNLVCNSCRSRIEFYFCSCLCTTLHRVTPQKNPVARNVAREVALCVWA